MTVIALVTACGSLTDDLVPTRPDMVILPALDPEFPRAAEFRHELPSGVPVFLAPDDDSSLVNIVFTFRGGRDMDSRDQIGLVEATGALVRTGGTTILSAEVLDEQLDTLAADVTVLVNASTTTATLNCPAANFVEALDLFVGMLRFPGYEGSRVTNWYDQQVAFLRQRNDHVGSVLAREWNSLCFGPDHFNARLTTAPLLQSMTARDFQETHSRIFHPGYLVIAASGGLDESEMLTRLARVLEGWDPRPPQVAAVSKPVPSGPGLYHVERDIALARIQCGMLVAPRDHPDAIPLMMLEIILGGPGGRLALRARALDGPAHTMESTYLPPAGHPGDFRFSMISTNAAVVPAINALLDEIQRLQDQPVSEAELDLTRAIVLARISRSHISRADMLAKFVDDEITGRDADHLAALRERVAAITASELRRVATQWLDPGVMMVLVVGRWGELGTIGREERIRMQDRIGDAITVLPGRDPLTLEALP